MVEIHKQKKEIKRQQQALSRRQSEIDKALDMKVDRTREAAEVRQGNDKLVTELQMVKDKLKP